MWQTFKTKFLSFIKGRAFKLVLVKLLKSQFMGGIKGWIVKLILEELWDDYALPILQKGLRRLGYIYRRHNGKHLVEKLDEAEQGGNQDEYDSISDDILNS